ncbi:vp80 [Euproctis pseudoconspersa nucleopolyhedrovirus]|uniref:Vp80 n=1 Tax=Euproctis pseudoconspersa nucleopolyhedrovirus TaxID=307467 RepID=C3TWZ9_9ABAC|nr:vp80 [Euproctis pseudoconspersa nucleopolyhedrovirus]ACO53541.1 vp80 [Euproctis pseudoconspersa nucleopolyhedrovirus]
MNNKTILSCVPMLGDGACVFRSISYMLYADSSRHVEVRNEIVNYILDNWADYKSFLLKKPLTKNGVDRNYLNEEEYASEMSQPITFATATEIKAASELYKLHIEIYQGENNEKLLYTFGDSIHPTKYLKFSGNLDEGHVDVLYSSVSLNKCFKNSYSIKYNHAVYLRDIIEFKINNDADPTAKQFLNEIDAEPATENINKNYSLLNAKLLYLHTKYNETIAMEQNLNNKIDEMFDLTGREHEQVKNETLAQIYVKINIVNSAMIFEDLHTLDILNINYDLKKNNILLDKNTYIDDLKNTINANDNFEMIFMADDVFRKNFLIKFIKRHSDPGPYNRIPAHIVNKIKSLDKSSTIENQPISVMFALKSLLTKVINADDVCCYNLILFVYRHEYDQITDKIVKTIIDQYDDFIPVKMLDPNKEMTNSKILKVRNDDMLVDTFLPASSPLVNYGTKRSAASSSELLFNKNYRNKLARINRNDDARANTTDDEEFRDRKRRRNRPIRRIKTRSLSYNRPADEISSANEPFKTSGVDENLPDRDDDQFLLDVLSAQSMPVYFIDIIVNVPVEVDLAYISCPTISLSATPELIDYKKTLSKIANIDLSPLNTTMHFYEMLSPLSYYGGNSIDESHSIWFISKSNGYFVMCADNYNRIIEQFKTEPDRDRIYIFVIKYNFLWHYRQFIKTLKHDALTAFRNPKILNALHIYNKVVQSKYDALNLSFVFNDEDKKTLRQGNNVVKLMLAQTV